MSLLSISIYCFEKSKYQQESRNKSELFIDQLSLKPSKYPTLIFEPDLSILIDCLKDAKIYLEFGSGGSTFAALLNSKTLFQLNLIQTGLII